MRLAIMQPYFLPYIGYWQLMGAVDAFVVYDRIKYTKKSWINRNRMLLNGSDAMFSLQLAAGSDQLMVCERELAPAFDRRKLLAFDAPLPLDLRFTRVDTGAAVDAIAHLRQVPADPQMAPLMQACLAGEASLDEARLFGQLWQDRVRRVLLEHGDDPQIFVIRPAA